MKRTGPRSDGNSVQLAAMPTRAGFLLVCAMFALPLLAAHAPARVKLIGLFPVAIAAAGGGILVFARPRLGISGTMARALAALLIPMMMGVFALESWQRWRGDRREMIVTHIKAQPGGAEILEALRTDPPPADPLMRELLKPYRTQMNPPVSWYIEERLSRMPIALSHTGSVYFTAAEWVLAVLAGIGVVVWKTRQGSGQRGDLPS